MYLFYFLRSTLFPRIGHFDHITNGAIQKKKNYQLFPVLQIVDLTIDHLL